MLRQLLHRIVHREPGIEREPGMFAGMRTAGTRRWTGSLLISASCHALFLLVVLWHFRPIFVKPSSVLEGNGGTSAHIVYLTREGLQSLAAAKDVEQPKKMVLPRSAKKRQSPNPESSEVKASTDRTTEARVQSPRAGSPFGSLSSGSATGEEVRPALPIAFADPAVFPWELPAGVHGDVVVEITIDTQGNIVGMKVLQTIGHGVDDKVLAALRRWRFRPATRDGVPIASEQDVHFHFPS